MVIWLVMPVHNERETVEPILTRVGEAVGCTVLVDDGSDDGTWEVLVRHAARQPDVVLLRHDRNHGMGAALHTGFAWVVREGQDGDVVVTMDADGQHRPTDIPALVGAVATGSSDVVIGRRAMGAYPWHKRIGNRGLTWLASQVSSHVFLDVECGFRAMRMTALRDILPFYAARRYGCSQEIAVLSALRGWRVRNDIPVEVPVYRSGARISDGWSNAWSALSAAWRVRTNRPARPWSDDLEPDGVARPSARGSGAGPDSEAGALGR